MSTGLTFGTISALYGLNAHIITRTQFSLLVTVVGLSAIVPPAIAQRWFSPDIEEEARLDATQAKPPSPRGAPRDANDFQGLGGATAAELQRPANERSRRLRMRHPLTREQIDQIDTAFRRRAQSVQAVDDMIARIEQALAANHIAQNTYIVFSSDNGLHTGEYRLMRKMTAFDTDIRVPLIVVGPGVPAGETRNQMTSNIDLADTFAALGETAFHGDGHSLVPLLHDQPPGDWRNAILVEHHGSNLQGADPDFQQPPTGNPETYEAMRTPQFLYVEYRDGERDYYDLVTDPLELQQSRTDAVWLKARTAPCRTRQNEGLPRRSGVLGRDARAALAGAPSGEPHR